MNPDIALVTGMFLAVLSIPSFIGALVELRAPIVAACVLAAGGALVFYAYGAKPEGYQLEDIPIVIFTVIAVLRDALFELG